MSSKQKKKSAAYGVRYTDAQKNEVVNFVEEYNKTNGRGGQNQAAKKFKMSVLTVSAWLKAAGKKGVKGAAKKAVKAVKAPAKKAAKAPAKKAVKAPAKKAAKKVTDPKSELEALKAAIRALVN